MSKVLCTFSGPFGDILWSLPTVRAISQMVGERVDFATMPEYCTLQDLFRYQPYIDKSFVIDDWKCEGSPHGNQPWNPPASALRDYDRCFHLTYRAHPGIGGKRLPLIDFIADQQAMKFVESPLPFITVRKDFGYNNSLPFVALAFNNMHVDLKLRFMEILRKADLGGVVIQDVLHMNWIDTATVIKHAICFVGCRSSNNVIAHGVGQKNIFIYEPDINRKFNGPFGDVFGCPYGSEVGVDASPEEAADMCIHFIKEWKAEKENQYAATQTESR